MNSSIQIDASYAEQLRAASLSLGHLLIWPVFEHPSDFPDWYIARPLIIRPKTAGPAPLHLMARELDTLRTLLPHGLTRLARQHDDDPSIVEVWV